MNSASTTTTKLPSVDTSSNAFAFDDSAPPAPSVTPPMHMMADHPIIYYDPVSHTEIDFSPGSPAFSAVGDRIYNEAMTVLPMEARSLAGKITGMLMDGHIKSGPSGVPALMHLSHDQPRVRAEIWRCLGVLTQDHRVWHQALLNRIKQHVRARHPKANAEKIAMMLVTDKLRQPGGEEQLQALINDQALLDTEVTSLISAANALNGGGGSTPLNMSTPMIITGQQQQTQPSGTVASPISNTAPMSPLNVAGSPGSPISIFWAQQQLRKSC